MSPEVTVDIINVHCAACGHEVKGGEEVARIKIGDVIVEEVLHRRCANIKQMQIRQRHHIENRTREYLYRKYGIVR